jgi:hypothetical protein
VSVLYIGRRFLKVKQPHIADFTFNVCRVKPRNITSTLVTEVSENTEHRLADDVTEWQIGG